MAEIGFVGLGAMGAGPPGAMHVNMGTVGIETADALARLHAEAGLQATKFVDILTDTAFTGSVYKGYGKLIAQRSYAPAFSVALGAKDLELVAQAADAHGLALPSMSTLRRVFAGALASPELAELDWSAIAEVTRRQGTEWYS